MDFNSARNRFQQAFQGIRENVEKTVPEDWKRSKDEALQLWGHAETAAREARRLSEEFVAEFKAAGTQIQSHLASSEFEAQLDQLLKFSNLNERYEAVHQRKQRKENGTDFANVNASVNQDPIDADKDEPQETKERKERIREKLAFLHKHYFEDVLNSAKAGGFLGNILGPQTAIRFAGIAGGLKMIIILGGVTYNVLIKPNGEWSMTEEKAEAKPNE